MRRWRRRDWKREAGGGSGNGLLLGRQSVISFLRRRASKRWNKRNLKALLEAGEELIWPDLAFSGILGVPWIRSMPFIWGSTFWDVALTDRRFLAVQFRLLPLFRRRVFSAPWPEVTQAELRIYTGMAAVVLRIQAQGSDEEFKLAYAAFDYAERTYCANTCLSYGPRQARSA